MGEEKGRKLSIPRWPLILFHLLSRITRMVGDHVHYLLNSKIFHINHFQKETVLERYPIGQASFKIGSFGTSISRSSVLDLNSMRIITKLMTLPSNWWIHRNHRRPRINATDNAS